MPEFGGVFGGIGVVEVVHEGICVHWRLICWAGSVAVTPFFDFFSRWYRRIKQGTAHGGDVRSDVAAKLGSVRAFVEKSIWLLALT